MIYWFVFDFQCFMVLGKNILFFQKNMIQYRELKINYQ
jgi:hypothetical protein